jgi:dihydrofolate synthase / folylpolyglutamate synthase
MNFFNYNSCYYLVLKELYSINQNEGMKLGLQSIERLCGLLGNPEKQFPAICVAGTNGKGSTVTKIQSTLTHAGYKVGLYTSPHISSFRERIRVNGKEISESHVALLLQKIMRIAKETGIPATFFEYVTALAFVYFAEEKVDVAVLETGLGGRLDATNVAEPILSIITSISLDHTAILGETIEEITREKAGIIKKNVPVVIGPKVPQESIRQIASSMNCPLFCVEDTKGDFEEENLLIARQAVECLSEKFSISKEALEQGLKDLPPCRFEIVAQSQLKERFGEHIPRAIILDVGHNPDAIQRLFSRIKNDYGDVPICVVYGASKDKDVRSCIELMLQKAESLYFVAARTPRAASVDDLMEQAQAIGSRKELFKCASIEEGMEQSFLHAVQKNQLLVVCGSFFIMHQVRRHLGFDEPYDCMDLNEQVTRK